MLTSGEAELLVSKLAACIRECVREFVKDKATSFDPPFDAAGNNLPPAARPGPPERIEVASLAGDPVRVVTAGPIQKAKLRSQYRFRVAKLAASPVPNDLALQLAVRDVRVQAAKMGIELDLLADDPYSDMTPAEMLLKYAVEERNKAVEAQNASLA